MIAIATKAMNAPIHARFSPCVFTKAPIGPRRVIRPRPNSTSTRGIDQVTRQTAQATRNSPPPLVAAMRGKRQMLPVPTAMLSMASIMAQREEKPGDWLMRKAGGWGKGGG
jgi:hypothetical protein